MKHSMGAAITCAGAVIGAGFASGREVVTFFSRYGENAWWLILLSVAVMVLLSCLCMLAARKCAADGCWCALFEADGTGARICTVMLLVLTSGAMVSASGSLMALLWAHRWAYFIGAAGTLITAWALGRRGVRWLGWISTLMTALLFFAVVLAMSRAPEMESARLIPHSADGWAALRAVGYAAMNMTLAIGVVCRCANGGSARRFGWAFGSIMAVLLYTSNALYLRHPEVHSSAFPVVELLRCLGRKGFLVSVAVLYLSVFTTMTATLCALGSDVKRPAAVLILPLLASCAGFSGIVDRLYAPAGLICLLLVFAPLCLTQIQSGTKERLDNLE